MQKTIVALIIYNRLKNLKLWLQCWQQCDKPDTQLIVIHNSDREEDSIPYRVECAKYNVQLVERTNIGMDIGAFQDVCLERLDYFPNDWDNLLWVTDDIIPMCKDFVQKYIDALTVPNVGAACLEISREVKMHIRTTGFIISKETSKQLTFGVDKITTLQQCYEFEHQSDNSFLEQIKQIGKTPVQITKSIADGYMWNVGNRSELNRWDEFNKMFYNIVREKDKVTFICPIYNRFPEIVSSLINQTHQNWQLLLIHDGVNTSGLKKVLDAINDERITFIERPTRQEQWGHPLRRWALHNIDELAPGTDYVVVTNDDNHHAPTYIESLLNGFKDNVNAVATYCSRFVHGYLSNQFDGTYRFGIIDSQLKLGYIDCACVLIRKDIAKQQGWSDMSHSSDWTYFKGIIDKHGSDKWVKVLGCLLVHN